VRPNIGNARVIAGKQQHQHQAQPEPGHHLAQHRQTRDDMVEHAVAIDDTKDTQRKSDDHGKQEGRARQLQRIRQSQGNEAGHIHMLSIGDAQVTLQRAAHVSPVLLQHRAIEPQRMAQLRPLLGRRVTPGDEPYGVPARLTDDESQK
jgi:hypothetical protein